TRDHYRHVVERLARASGRREVEVATEALALAGEDGEDERSRHVGHYLAGKGLSRLEARLHMRPGVAAALRRAGRARPLLSYLGGAMGFTALFVAAALVHAAQDGAGIGLLVALGLLGALGASQLALGLVNLMATRLAAPVPLPRMDFSA